MWAPELSIFRSKNLNLSAKAWQEKKDCCRQKIQNWQSKKSFILATRLNVAEPGKSIKKKNDQNQNWLGGTARDLSQVR